MDEIGKSNQILSGRLDSLDQLRDTIDRLDNDLVALQTTVGSSSSQFAELRERAEEAKQNIENVKQTVIDNYAQNTEVQAMVKDVLLIW